MSFSTTYNYQDRNIFDVQTLIDALRLIVINFILAFILLFLVLEEIDWTLFASSQRINDEVMDNTSWNIKKIF